VAQTIHLPDATVGLKVINYGHLDPFGSALGKILADTLDKPDLESLSTMLISIGQACGGFGCTLWQLRDGPEPTSSLPTLDNLSQLSDAGQLYVLTHGFANGYKSFCHDLPLERASGKAVRLESYEVTDSATDPAVDRESVFYRQAHPGSQLAKRIVFPDGTVGVMTLYRKEKGPLTDHARDLFYFLADQVPRLYQTVTARTSYRLVADLSNLIEMIEDPAPAPDEQAQGQVMLQLCEVISFELRCREVSLFLANQQTNPGSYKLIATTCPEMAVLTEYRANEPGLTPYALQINEPLFVLDVLDFPKQLRARSGWMPRVDIPAVVSQLLMVKSGEELPPVSAAVVPISIEGQVIGVLRCGLRPLPPYFFAEREVPLLRILASKIGSFWSRQIRLQEMRHKEGSWRSFVEQLNGLNRHTQEISAKSKGSSKTRVFQKEIYQEALRALRTSIEGADCLDVSLPDADRKTIGPEIVEGKYWDRSHAKTGLARPHVRLHLSDVAGNAWAHVFVTKKHCFYPDTTAPGIPYAGFIPEAKQALFVPILADRDCIGVISVRSSTRFADIESAQRMTELVAQEIALYHRLTNTLSQQARAYADMEHQLRTPIFQALKRTEWLIQQEMNTDINLLAAHGLLRKSRRVLSNMRLYEQLAAEQPLTVKKEEVTMDSIIILAIEVAKDNQLLCRARNVTFQVDKPSFENTRLTKVILDRPLLEQVLNNLLDNSGKYSDQNSVVTVVAHLDEESNLVLTVKDKGVKLTREDAEKMGTYGFRGKQARRRTTEGSGIGLYIVRQIMAAHRGNLHAEPTDPLGFNRVSVSFPQK